MYAELAYLPKGFHSLTNVMIGNSVTTIGNEAFFRSGLTSVTIGNNRAIITCRPGELDRIESAVETP